MDNEAQKAQGLPLSESAAKALKANQKPHKSFGHVTVGSFFSQQIFTFRPNEMRFLKEYLPGVSVEEAAKKAGVPAQVGERLLRRKSAREFLQDRFQQIAIQDGWTVERWFSEGDKVWRGQKEVTREQLDIWKEFGARILPKARTVGASENGTIPQITINIGAVDEAFQRQRAIEAQVLDGPGQ